jgi:hypothetical protein
MSRLQQVVTHASTTVALLAAVLVAPAQAGEPVVYAGSACQPVFEFLSDPNNNNTERMTRFNGRLRNTSSQSFLGIDCPIVRTQSDATKGFKATVRVHNRGTRVSVAAQSRDAFGGFVDGASQNVLSLGPQEVTLIVDQSVPNGTYTLGLNLSPSSEISSYMIEELP